MRGSWSFSFFTLPKTRIGLPVVAPLFDRFSTTSPRLVLPVVHFPRPSCPNASSRPESSPPHSLVPIRAPTPSTKQGSPLVPPCAYPYPIALLMTAVASSSLRRRFDAPDRLPATSPRPTSPLVCSSCQSGPERPYGRRQCLIVAPLRTTGWIAYRLPPRPSGPPGPTSAPSCCVPTPCQFSTTSPRPASRPRVSKLFASSVSLFAPPRLTYPRPFDASIRPSSLPSAHPAFQHLFQPCPPHRQHRPSVDFTRRSEGSSRSWGRALASPPGNVPHQDLPGAPASTSLVAATRLPPLRQGHPG
jgi:hypothetical protein